VTRQLPINFTGSIEDILRRIVLWVKKTINADEMTKFMYQVARNFAVLQEKRIGLIGAVNKTF